MSIATEPAQAVTVCVNHPQTETYLRCNKCGKPVCIKCVQRTPVGYRCNDCLGIQRAGYYNATTLDYVLAAIIGMLLGGIGGFVITLIPFWLIAIFAGPIAGGIIAESIRRAVGKRRGRYLALVACIAITIGALLALFVPALSFVAATGSINVLLGVAPRVLVNIGFWIFLALALATTYARLRS
jgi:hypothetical protein